MVGPWATSSFTKEYKPTTFEGKEEGIPLAELCLFDNMLPLQWNHGLRVGPLAKESQPILPELEDKLAQKGGKHGLLF